MKVLAQFKTIPNYVDFCLPELKSLIAMHGLDWREVFKHEFQAEAPSDDSSSTETYIDDKCEFYGYMHHVTPNKNLTRLPFPESVVDIRHTSFRRFPFMYLELPSLEVSRSMISRSMMIDVFIEAIGEAHCYDELLANGMKIVGGGAEVWEKCNIAGKKIIFEVDPYNFHLSQKEVIERIEIVTEGLKMKGKIDLKHPDQCFWVMERHIDPFTRQTSNIQINTLLDVFFGIEIARANSCSRISHKKNMIFKYDLKNRSYLGPTSTDNVLAFLMCNQGQAEAGSMIFDPFVGSGSLLIPPSHYGSICYGGDLDPRVLHGFGVGRLNKQSKFFQERAEYCKAMTPKIMLNFEQYELPKPTVIRMDCVNTSFRAVEIFDAIICDPPYGFRAILRTADTVKKEKKVRKSKQVKSNEEEVEEETKEEVEEEEEVVELSEDVQKAVEEIKEKIQELAMHEQEDCSESQQPSQQKSQLAERMNPIQTSTVSVAVIVAGLISLADRVLVEGGRLVFLYPIEREIYNKQNIAGILIPNFQLIDYSENPLSEKKSRILVTLMKIKGRTSAVAAEEEHTL